MTVHPGVLGEVNSTWCLLFVGSSQEVAASAFAWSEAGLTIRTLRGRKMRSYQALFDEFAAALQFPWYFGENGNAFDECITDLTWLPPCGGYVLIIRDAAAVLADTNDGLAWLARSLADAAAEWAQPVESGDVWDRPAVPFHAVLQSEEAAASEVRTRWMAAGVRLGSIA